MKIKLVLLIAAVTILAACKKENTTTVNSVSSELTEDQFKVLTNNMKSIPLSINVIDEVNNRVVEFNVRERTISCNRSWNFANPTTNTIYGQAGGLTVYVSSSSVGWGSGSPTHSITAGSTTLNVQTLCLAVDASAYASMFAGATGSLPIDGISVVMGLDADFSLLANSSSSSFGNYFKGLAYYLVYDFNASGSYPVIDWLNYSTFPNSEAFSMVFSFTAGNNGGFYFSENGNINVSGGDMTFTGNYWGIESNFSAINPSLSYGTFSGSGTMGCN